MGWEQDEPFQAQIRGEGGGREMQTELPSQREERPAGSFSCISFCVATLLF